jgi:hypothetical protein
MSALVGGDWSASRPGRFTFKEKAPGTHWIGGWMGPRAASGRRGEVKILHPTGTRYIDCAISAPNFVITLKHLLKIIQKLWKLQLKTCLYF